MSEPDVPVPADRRYPSLDPRRAAASGGRDLQPSSSGRPLPRSVRGFFEPRFGVDLGGVRVYDDREANDLTRTLDASAFTYGTDIHFGPGRYRPSTASGKALLAHELTHVLQQTGGRRARRPTGTRDATPWDRYSKIEGAPIIQRKPDGPGVDDGMVDSERDGAQRDGGDDGDLGPERRVDDATWEGFSRWWASADADATDTLERADEVAGLLDSPYAERFDGLLLELQGTQNRIANGVTALQWGVPAPWLTSDPIGLANRLEESIVAVGDVTGAWGAVLGSGILELMASFGEERLRYARWLRSELRACRRELEDLSAMFDDPAVREALAQFGINAAISAAVIAIGIVNPVVGLGVAIAGAATQLTLDSLLGPDEPGAESFTAAGASTAGSAAEALGSGRAALRFTGRGLGIVGALGGSTLDFVEVYQANKARLVRVGTRMQELARKLEPLWPLLRYPLLARSLIDGLGEQAARLREEGQLALEARGQ